MKDIFKPQQEPIFPADLKSAVTVRTWLSMVSIVLLFIVAMIDRNGINLIIDPVRRSLSITDFQVSLVQGPAFAVFFLFGSLASGWIIDRYSNRWIIFLSVMLWSAATLASGFSENFIALLAARSMVGLGESVLQPAGWNIMSRLFPKHRLATALSILTAATQAGVAASFLLTGFLVSESTENPIFQNTIFGVRQPWQWIFIAAGILGLILALTIFVVPEKRREDGSKNLDSSHSLMGFVKSCKAYLVCHFIGFGIISIMVNGAGAWIPTYLTRIHHIDIKEVAILLGFGAVSLGVCGVILAGILVDRSFAKGSADAHFTHFSIRAVIIAVIGPLGFYLFGTSHLPLLIIFGIIQFTQPFSGVAGAALQIATPEIHRSKITAIFIMFYNALGMIIGPSFIAGMTSFFGEDSLGLSLAVNYGVLGISASGILALGRKFAKDACNGRIES